MDTAQKLINILLDTTIDEAVRDDAAIDLGFISNNEMVEAALLSIANDQTTEEMIRASCGESLAQIWLSNQNFKCNKINLLDGVAFKEAIALIKVQNPLLYKETLPVSSNTMPRCEMTR